MNTCPIHPQGALFLYHVLLLRFLVSLRPVSESMAPFAAGTLVLPCNLGRSIVPSLSQRTCECFSLTLLPHILLTARALFHIMLSRITFYKRFCVSFIFEVSQWVYPAPSSFQVRALMHWQSNWLLQYYFHPWNSYLFCSLLLDASLLIWYTIHYIYIWRVSLIGRFKLLQSFRR